MEKKELSVVEIHNNKLSEGNPGQVQCIFMLTAVFVFGVDDGLLLFSTCE